MARLGEYGAARREAEQESGAEPDTAVVFGVEVRLPPKVAFAPLADFADEAARGTDADDLQGVSAIKRLFLGCVHPDDRDKAWKAVVEAGADLEEVLGAAMGLFEDLTGRPTKSPTASRGGRSRTSPSSSRPRKPKALPQAATGS